MQRCINLARWGAGRVAPNPMVGAVITHQNKIIGEGYHAYFGGPHAEVNAINSIPKKKKNLLENATLYVNLEPCHHQGKTPPCTQAIIENDIPEVVIGMNDPSPKTKGRGVNYLREKGIEIREGVLSNGVQQLNQRFITYHEQQRPYIILKWAQTQDGYIAPPSREPLSITNNYSLRLVHKWRAQEQSIMVGGKTVINDNPALTVREWYGAHPLRLIVATEETLPPDARIFNEQGETWVFQAEKGADSEDIRFIKLSASSNFIVDMLQYLFRANIQSVFVEGGQQLLNTFIAAELWDEARIFTGDMTLGEGIEAPTLRGKLVDQHYLKGDRLYIYNPLS